MMEGMGRERAATMPRSEDDGEREGDIDYGPRAPMFVSF